MRKYAHLNEPRKRDESLVYKVMLYETDEGFYLFEYDRPDAVICSSDLLYESLEELHEEWDPFVDEKGWIGIEDPLPGCQHDAFIPLRIKDRTEGKPEWGRYEVLIDEEWVDYDPDDLIA